MADDIKAKPRVFTIPPGESFLGALAEAVLAGDLPEIHGEKPGPLDLPAITLLLPTRRAGRSLQDAFLDRAANGPQGKALLLPRIRPIAEGEEDLTLLTGLVSLATLGGSGAETEDAPPAISTLERRLVLTELVMKWAEASRDASAGPEADIAPVVAPAQTPAQAAHLAAGLAALMDEVETEGADFTSLAKLVDPKYSEHWKRTLDFLTIVTQMWPQYLTERHLSSPMARRDALIRAETHRLRTAPPKQPIIVAGVTGSVPATAELMAAVAALRNGAIVLPGLDLALDDAGWQAISSSDDSDPGHPEHPQFGMKKLLDRLGVARNEVRVLTSRGSKKGGSDASAGRRTGFAGGKIASLFSGAARRPQHHNETLPLFGSENEHHSHPSAAAIAPRHALIAEAMRPAGTTQHWQSFLAGAGRRTLADSLTGVSVLDAANAQEEAEAIALILREAAEHPTRTAALVTPDRLLARRVAVRLEAWGLRVDDSAGRPFAKTAPGAFLDLIITAAANRFAPADLLALLKHPLTRLGYEPGRARRAARAVELIVLRGIYLGEGLSGIATALGNAGRSEEIGNRRPAAARRLWPEDRQAAADLIAALQDAFAPLTNLASARKKAMLRDLASAHYAVAEQLARDAAGNSDTLRQEPAGEAAGMLFNALKDDTLQPIALQFEDYPDFYRSLIQGTSVRAQQGVHPRLSIWGPLEARLQQADVMILGSLNDGTWPEPADPGPWLNRPMRMALRLPSPEEKIGHAAHDLTMFLGAQTVVMTRAAKIGGVPTVPSRWLMRLQALLKGLGLEDALRPPADKPWLAWARLRDDAGERPEAIKAPAPCPPLDARPRKLSVTQIEAWMANPYSIYARHILKLEALPALAGEPDAALRGQILHETLARFCAAHPTSLPADPRQILVEIAHEVLGEYAAHPRVAAFWQPRIARFANWFAETEPARREGNARLVTEVRGSHQLAAPGGIFTLTARADRIDIGAALTITDYKTGMPPNDARVNSLEAPQLPLEAAIAAAGGFENLPAGNVAGLRYIRASGGEPPGEERIVKVADATALATQALARLSGLIAEFDLPSTPYKAVRRARFTYDYDEFAHLARVAEWQTSEAES